MEYNHYKLPGFWELDWSYGNKGETLITHYIFIEGGM